MSAKINVCTSVLDALVHQFGLDSAEGLDVFGVPVIVNDLVPEDEVWLVTIDDARRFVFAHEEVLCHRDVEVKGASLHVEGSEDYGEQ